MISWTQSKQIVVFFFNSPEWLSSSSPLLFKLPNPVNTHQTSFNLTHQYCQWCLLLFKTLFPHGSQIPHYQVSSKSMITNFLSAFLLNCQLGPLGMALKSIQLFSFSISIYFSLASYSLQFFILSVEHIIPIHISSCTLSSRFVIHLSTKCYHSALELNQTLPCKYNYYYFIHFSWRVFNFLMVPGKKNPHSQPGIFLLISLTPDLT